MSITDNLLSRMLEVMKGVDFIFYVSIHHYNVQSFIKLPLQFYLEFKIDTIFHLYLGNKLHDHFYLDIRLELSLKIYQLIFEFQLPTFNMLTNLNKIQILLVDNMILFLSFRDK